MIPRTTMMMVTLLMLICSGVDGWSQDTWVKTFGGTGDEGGNSTRGDGGSSMTTTSDGKILIVGTTFSNDGDFVGLNKGNGDIFLIKLEKNGNVLWKRTYGGSGEDWGYSITTTSDDRILITGGTNSNDGDFKGMNKGLDDIFVIKLDEDGEIHWKKTYGGTGSEGILQYPYGTDGMMSTITTTLDGGILIAGETTSNDGDFIGMNKGRRDIFVIKLDGDGDVLWKKTFGGTYWDSGYSITTTSNNKILVTGGTSCNDGDFLGMNKNVNNGGTNDIVVLNLDNDGSTMWKKTFGGTGAESGHSITTTPDGGVLITGATLSNNYDFNRMNKGVWDIFVIKLDKDGSILWKKTYGGTEWDKGNSVITTLDGSILVTGRTSSNNGDFKNLLKGSAFDIFVLKLDKDGSILWKKTYGGTDSEGGCVISTSSDGGIVVTGYTTSNDGDFYGMWKGVFSNDIFVMKLDSNGNLNPSTSVTDYTSITPSLLVTPNPISTSSTVVFSTGTSTTVRIELLNTLGESVSVLHDGFMESGEHRVPLGVSSVSSGVYYVRMTSEGTVNSTQVLLVK